MKISFIITIYNKADCLGQLIQALTVQQGEFDREYIFIDDGSTDDSLQVIETCTNGMENVIIVSQANAGPSVAVNTGLKHASGNYARVIDGDDKITPDSTAILLNAIKETGCKLARGIHVDQFHPAGNTDGKVTVMEDSLKRAIKFFPFGSSTALVDMHLVKMVGGCDERIFIQDYSISLRLAEHTNFAIINTVVARNIDMGQQRLSADKVREHRDTALARYYFIKDSLLSDELKLYALKCQLSSAWRYYRKQGITAYCSKLFMRYILSKTIPKMIDKANILPWMEEACEIY